MRNLAWLARAGLGIGLVSSLTTTDALAQAALDDEPVAPVDGEVAPVDETGAPPAATQESPANLAYYGAGLRLRNIRVPNGLAELFVESAPGGSSTLGVGVEVMRRKGNFEVSLGLEYEKISFRDGIWVKRDELPPAYEVDYVEFDGFGWIGLDVTFLNHTPLSKYVALRYGGGVGLGILLGDVKRTDYVCSSSALSSCSYQGGANNQNPYDLPPVFPIINAIFGAQVRPIENLVLNFELGIRTVPFLGTTIGYYF